MSVMSVFVLVPLPVTHFFHTTMFGRLLLAVGCLLLLQGLAEATSDADRHYVFLCDAHSDLFGCNTTEWTGGNRLACKNKTRVMSWASQPVRSDCYHIIAGDEDAPATAYTPDEYMFINIRVTCYEMLYRGIMLYAEAGPNKTKVGDWYLPFDEPALFHLPWGDLPDDPCHKTLMHASGIHKPYHAAVHFKAPPVGTGQITFKALIKEGDANSGDFFWPQEDISLAEGTPTVVDTALEWVQSAVGQSCSDACKAVSLGCDGSKFGQLSSPDTFQNVLGGQYACKLPILSGCGELGASLDGSDQWCYFLDNDCMAQNRTPSTVTCTTTLSDGQRFCPCSSNVDIMESAAPSVSAMMKLAVFLPLLFVNEKFAFAFSALVLLSGSSVDAHNWVHSSSRSVSASTYTPCKQPLTDLPHTQVGPGQSFSIEWMTGHGFPTYFAIVHSDDSDKLRLNTPALLDDYLAKAPTGSNNAQDPKWSKYHRKPTNTTDNDVTDGLPDFFLRVVPPTDPYYIPRPLAVNVTSTLLYQMQYKPEQLKDDVRAAYKSDLYPWILAVAKFYIVTLAPSRWDTALFQIPSYAKQGRHIVHYQWRGYRDCVDVDYKAETTVMPYGYKYATPMWARIDHCLFQKVPNIFHVSEIVTDPQYCLDMCLTNGGCFGVNVVPLKAPSTAYQSFTPRGTDSWLYPAIYGTDMYVPWNHTYFEPNRTALRSSLLSNASFDNYICYTVQPRPGTDTEDEYTIATDPQDPLFYSTCFFRLAVNMFDDYANGYLQSSAQVDTPWRFQDKCIDCKYRSLNSYPRTTPKWNVGDICVNCDLEPSPQPAPFFPLPISVEQGVKCDGVDTVNFTRPVHHTCVNGSLECIKKLLPVGRLATSPVSLEECRVLVLRDPECTDTFTWTNRTTSSRCQCYVKKACCNVCSRVVSAQYSVYEVKSTPDPKCANGVLSADLSACCSSTCKNCTVSTATSVDFIGFCASNAIQRPCAEYGAPCKMPLPAPTQ